MGLLEKAQQLKESKDEKKKRITEIEEKTEEPEGFLNKVKEKRRIQPEKKDINTTNEPGEVITIDDKLEGPKSDGLLNRIEEKKRTQSEKKDIIPTNESGEVITIDDKLEGSKPDGLLDR
jgi:hypothetical protein